MQGVVVGYKIDCIETNPWGGKASKIKENYILQACNRQLSKGCLRAALRASQSDRNNIPYSIKLLH